MNATVTETEVHERIVDWCTLVTDLVAIKAHEGGKRPSGQYLMVNLLTGPNDVRFLPADIEFAETGEDNSEGNPQIEAIPVIESEWKFSIHSMNGSDVLSPLRKMRSRAKMEGPQLGLDSLLSIHEVGDVKNVPEMINNEYEPRGHMMVRVRGYTRDGFLIDVIDSAPITVTKT